MTEPLFRPFTDESWPHHGVRSDVVDGLAPWFRPAGDDPMSAWRQRVDVIEDGDLTNGRVDVVAWRYEAEPLPDVWGVAARRGAVLIDGVTFADRGRERGDERFTRYIDWHGTFVQLGVAAAGRIVSDPGDRRRS